MNTQKSTVTAALTSTRLRNRVKKLTQQNDHGGAFLAIAKAFGVTSIENEIEIINRAHNRLGYLSEKLHLRRNAAVNDLRNRLTELLGKDSAEQVWTSLYV